MGRVLLILMAVAILAVGVLALVGWGRRAVRGVAEQGGREVSGNDGFQKLSFGLLLALILYVALTAHSG